MVFSYKAINRSGELKVGTLECLSQSGAVLELGRMHLVPVEIRAASRHLPPWLTDQYHYGAYGEPPTTDAATGNPFRYTGRYLDAETGLYYYRARYYSAKLGRFLQTDPIGTKDDLDLYAYVGNDPLAHTDPTGNTGACNKQVYKSPCPPPSTGSHIPGVHTGATGVPAQSAASAKANSRAQSQGSDTAQSQDQGQSQNSTQSPDSTQSQNSTQSQAPPSPNSPASDTPAYDAQQQPVGPEDSTGAGENAQRAIDAAADAYNYDVQKWNALQQRKINEAKGFMAQEDKAWATYYKYCGCS